MKITSISLLDLLISFIVILFVYGFATLFKPKNDQHLNKYYFPFITLKIIWALAFALIHVFYYKGGDTFLYFSGANFFSERILADPLLAVKLYFGDRQFVSMYAVNFYQSYAIRSSEDVFFMSKILGLFSFVTANQYLACSILYTLVTSIGVWKLLVVLSKLYPSLTKYFVWGLIYYPSFGIWSSGILKDPVAMACVGLLFYSTYQIIEGKSGIKNLIYIALASFICFKLKPYILYTFIPVLLLWSQGRITQKLKSPALKFILTPIIVAIFGIAGYFSINSVSSGAGKYSLESVQSVAEGFQSWHTYLAETRDQSGYSLGEVEFTPIGVLRKAPEAFFVAYFRPFIIGDVRNIATLFEAVQALILLIVSIFIFIKVGIFKSFKIMVTNPDVRAFMLFAVIFGVTVGLTSYNFGALSRYKIPGVPFYIASISIIYYLGYLKPKGLWK